LHDKDDFFRFTRGRFVRNEVDEMSQQEILFNIRELAHLAAEAVDIKSCVDTSKYPDGMYSKALFLTVENGARVVDKVPNPNAGRPHFTTASEVATMEFVCLVPPWANVRVNFESLRVEFQGTR
jgi:hypothetical protein